MEVVEQQKRFLTADAILSADDLGHADVFVDQWGGFVRVRGMTAGERSQFAAMFGGDEIPRDATARMVHMCAVDESGDRLFSEADVERLAAKNAQALEAVAGEIMRLSGMRESVDDAEKK